MKFSSFSYIAGSVLIVLYSATSSISAEHNELKAFPPAEKGMKRYVITLDHKERGEEDSFKVELVPGKKMMTDGVNLMRLGCKLEPRPLKGWGYTFYELTGTGPAMSTMMAPPPGTKQVKKFVSGTPLLIRYNSRLPIVIYAPDGYEVQYRIWSAPPDTTAVKPDINLQN